MRIFQHSVLTLAFFILTLPAWPSSGPTCVDIACWDDDSFKGRKLLSSSISFPINREKSRIASSTSEVEEPPANQDTPICDSFPLRDISNHLQPRFSKNGKRSRRPLSRSVILRPSFDERKTSLFSPSPTLPTLNIIQNNGIILRTVSPTQDLDFGNKVFGDEEMMAYWEDGQPKSSEKVLENLMEWKGRALKENLSWRVIIDAESNESVGFFGATFFNLDEEDSSEEGTCIEISYCLEKEARGKDYTRRACIAVIRQALEQEGPVAYIRAHAHPDNLNSIAFLIKRGFKDVTPNDIHHYNDEYGENGARKEFRLSYDACCTLVNPHEPDILLDQEPD